MNIMVYHGGGGWWWYVVLHTNTIDIVVDREEVGCYLAGTILIWREAGSRVDEVEKMADLGRLWPNTYQARHYDGRDKAGNLSTMYRISSNARDEMY
jgi:hypothetical protein